MSAILGKIFARRGRALKIAQTTQDTGDAAFRKHAVDHEVIDRHHGHDHGESGDHDYIEHTDELKESSASVTEGIQRTVFTAPSFMLNLWAVLPLLLLAFAFGNGTIIVLAIVTVVINFFIINMKVHDSKRYVAAGIISFMALVIYLMIK